MNEYKKKLPYESDKEYVWRRKCEIAYFVEDLWLKYLQVLDYPKIDFVDYVAKNSGSGHGRVAAEYMISIWRYVKRFSPMHLN
jgi:hypothetical protein